MFFDFWEVFGWFCFGGGVFETEFHYLEQVGLQTHRDPAASASSVLELKVCATITSPLKRFFFLSMCVGWRITVGGS